MRELGKFNRTRIDSDHGQVEARSQAYRWRCSLFVLTFTLSWIHDLDDHSRMPSNYFYLNT